ncbi:MAG: DUF1292 domain-containing protein [Myxococcales bacterium]|nr:DUF1292 domain-containing protein [Myxococcales bacterium]
MAKKEDKITMIPPVPAAVAETELEDDGAEDGEDEEWDDDGEDSDTVILVDAEGVEREFVFLAVVDMEDEGQFAALTPAEEDEDGENTEVFLFHYEEDEDGAESFTPIEDEDLFARVQTAAEEMFKQMDHEDGDEDGEENAEANAEEDGAHGSCEAPGHAHDHGHDPTPDKK